MKRRTRFPAEVAFVDAEHRTFRVRADAVADGAQGRIVLDLKGGRHPRVVPLLRDGSGERLGSATSLWRATSGVAVDASGVLASGGVALDERHRRFASPLPYAADLVVEPKRVERVPSGRKAEVNGKTMHGPLVIFREWSARELTLSPHRSEVLT